MDSSIRAGSWRAVLADASCSVERVLQNWQALCFGESLNGLSLADSHLGQVVAKNELGLTWFIRKARAGSTLASRAVRSA
jgi:hypothetical protein